MANNRLYLTCRGCGETLFLGKHMMDGFYWQDYGGGPLQEQLNEFFDKHIWCNGEPLECFDVEYEEEPEWRNKSIIRRGRWVADETTVRCSECGKTYWGRLAKPWNYCPNCGAKVEEKK